MPVALQHPIVQAPMAGGPSTPALAVAVSDAGGLGFLAAGYLPAARVREQLAEVSAGTARPLGVNLFVPPIGPGDADAVAAYAERLRAAGFALGEPRHDDDGWEDKLALVLEAAVPVVSFAFGCPPADVVAALQRGGTEVWVTITTPQEAVGAAEAGADAVVAQGVEAGGHRGGFDDAAPGDLGLLALLALVAAAAPGLPVVATGGLMTGASVAAVLAAGAVAAQLGSAFLLADEAGTSEAHRRALREGRPTALTRAFSGRTARGLVNRFMAEHDAAAPRAYPEVHHLTSPLRAAARERGNAEAVNLWAGQAHALALEAPAAEIVRTLAADARQVIEGRLRGE